MPLADVDEHAPGRAPGAQPGRDDDAPQRRQQVVDEVADDRHPFRRVRDRPERAHQPGVIERVLAGPGSPDDVDVGQGHGRCGDRRPHAAAAHDEVGRRPRDRSRRVAAASRTSAARAAAMRSAAPSPAASAHGAIRSSRMRSRMRWRSDGTVDHSEDPVHDRVVGLVRGHGGRRDDRQAHRSAHAPDRRLGRRADPGVVTQDDRLDAAMQHVRQRLGRRTDGAPRVVRRHGHLEQQLAERIRPGERPRRPPRADRPPATAAPGRRPLGAAAAASTIGPGRAETSPNSSSVSDIAPDRTIGTSGRRTATAETSAASSRIALRSSGRGGSPAPTRMASMS